MEAKGFVRDTSNAAVSKGTKKQKTLAHGDDFLVLATQKHIDEFEATSKDKFQPRKEWQIGFGAQVSRTGRVLNRIITFDATLKRAVI